ncbi:transglycosylase SLT domain-containing protein [Hydrogenivirga sp.]
MGSGLRPAYRDQDIKGMKTTLVCLFLLFFSLPVPAQDTFRDFLREELKGFSEEKEGFRRYLEEVNREFEEYKRITYEEFRRFKGEVLKHWDKYEAPTRKKLVQYSRDFKTKRVFDFEKGELRIEVKGDRGVLKRRLRSELKDFLTEDKREAFRKDPVLRRVERRLKRSLKHVRTSSVDREPLITPIVLGRDRPTYSELERGVDRLLRRGHISSRRTARGLVSVFSVKVPPRRVLSKARRYKPIVVKESKRWNLSYPLIFAIIHTESYFNPLARSHVPAYGLMQIVPHTAGRDVTEFLFGKPVLLSPSYLYNARNNIKIGTTYVHMLYYRYFKDVRDPESRLYCTIAAYNTGPGNVARAFVGSRNLKKAVRVINRLSPEDVYGVLIRNLPYGETKEYLRKVSTRIAVYRNL